MSKVWTIAVREYLAAVRTKGFIISLVLMPVLMAGGAFAGSLAERVGDSSTRKVAVIDHTGGFVHDALAAAVEEHNADLTNDGGRQVRPRFELERVEAAADAADAADDAALMDARFALSQRVRDGELLAFVEVGRDLLEPKIDFEAAAASMAPAAADAGEEAGEEEVGEAGRGGGGGGGSPLGALDLDARMEQMADLLGGDDGVVRYATNKPTYQAFRDLMADALQQSVPAERLARSGVPQLMVVRSLLLGSPPVVTSQALYNRDASGNVTEEAKAGRIIEGFVVPLGLVFLMFIVILTGASPMTTNVIEEKQLRIAEVLLSGVRPFGLMLGKLLGGVGVALTLAVVYAGGALLAAGYFGFIEYVRPELLAWLVVFTVVATMLYGALFAAAGAAVTNVKEAQSLITPVMLVLVVPLAMFMPILQNPNGPLAVALGYFPLSAPLVTMMRVSVPPGIPFWQAALGALSGLAGTAAIVWASGRIFRIGMLAGGKAPTPKELLGWIVRG